MEEALEHLNQHSYTTEKCDATGSDSLQNSRPDKTNPFCETVKDAETNSILCKTTNIENLTSVTVGVMGNDEGELFGEKPLRVEVSLQDTSKDSDGPSGDANLYKLQKEDKVDTEEINDKEDLLRDRNLNLDISASPNDISQETCSETHELTSEEKNDEAGDVRLKIPLVHSSSIEESGIVFSEKDHDGLTRKQRQGPDEECNKMEMENVTDEEAATDKFTTEEEVIVPKYVNEGMNTEMGENIGTEVAEEKNKDEDILIHEYKNQQISDLREGKCSTSSIVHIDAVSPESTDGVEIVEESIEDNATKKIGNDVSSKEAAPQYGEIFSEKLEKGNSVSDEKYFKLASSQDDPETGPTGISTVKVEVASEENIMSETDKDQLEVTTAKLAEYALDEQNLCTASVAEDPTTQILKTGDSVNAHTVENSDQMLHEHNHETAIERQIVEKDGTFSEMPMPENSENFVANKDVKLENLSDEVDQKKHEKITDNVPDKYCFQEIENTESEELESDENRSNVGDKISTSEITGRNVIDEQETYLRNEKGDIIVKEIGSDNVIFTYHSAAQLIEKVHPINEEESKKLDEISDVMYDDGLSCEKVPDKADANRQILKCDMLDISEDPVREGLMENEKITENLESVSEDTYTETIANIGATNNGSGNEGDDDLSIVEASGLGKEPGAPDVQISMETEELRGNSNPEKESTDMVLNVKERSKEDEKTSEVENLNGKESTREDEKLDIASEPAFEDQAGETNSKATTNIHDLIDENHPEEEQNIKTVNQYDEPETAKSKDGDNKEMYVSDDSDSYELAKGKMDDKGGKQREEKAKSGCEEKTYQTMNVENNEVNIQEEKTDMEKLSVSEDENEETSGESVGTNIHYSIDGDNPEKEIITVNQNNESETEKLKDDDIKEMNVGDFSDSNELAETITHEIVGKQHEETANSVYEEENNQVEYIDETNIQEEKTHIVKLEINSEPISEDQIEEINSELFATNIHDLIDDGNQEKKQNIEMVNLNDEPEAAKLKDEDNKEIYVDDISGSYELAERTIHDKIGKRHVEKMNSGGEEEICQTVNVKNNEVEIQKEKVDREKVGITSETVSGDQIEESQETVATNIHNSIDDDNPEKEQNIKTVTLNDDPETTKLKDEDDKEIFVGKWHEETSNSGCEEQTCQTVDVENNEVHIQEEKTESEKLEITLEAVSEDQVKESREISQESVATNIHDSINDDNPEKEIIMVNKNYESETAKLKDAENNEMNVCNHSDSHELDEEKTQEEVGKRHEEITNSGCEKEFSQMLDVNDNDETDIVEEKTNIEKLGIDSESISEEQTEEIKSKLVATNNHGSIANDNQELKQRIKIVNLNDEPETARLTDEENKEMYDGNVSDSFEFAEGTTHNKVGKWHEETSDSRCEEETCQKVDVENNNEVDILEEKRDSEKLGITSKTVSDDQFEQSQETSQESVAADIHDSVDDANSEKEIITVNQNDESEMEKLKDEDIKEMNVGDISDSHELAETTTHETVGKRHEETANSGCEEETNQVEDIKETNIQEEKTYIKMLEINSEPISEDQIEEINCELVATNNHDLIDDGNQEKKQNIEMVNLNDEPETAKLKDEDNKGIYVGDISGSYELAEGTIQDKVGKRHEEKTNSGGEEETCQAVNVENNKVDIQKEKIDSEKVGITSETVSGDQIEESQETSQETVATNIHNSIDDDNPEKEQNIKMVTLNDDPETAKLKDEDNKEIYVSDVSDSYELAEGTTHNKVGKWHEETSNSGCEEETCQMENVENNNKVDIQEEKADSEKLGITSETISEDQIEERHEISQESVAPNIHDSINDDNPEKEIIMVNKNYEAETVKLKDDDNKEMNVGDLSDSHELNKEATHERVSKQHEEIANSGCDEETCQILDVDDNDETDIVEEKTNIEKLGIDSESISGEETEEIKSELVATNIHGSIDDDNQELKQNIRRVNLNDEPETAMLTDEDNKEMYVGDASDSFESAEEATHNKIGKRHEETSNSGCEEETCQKVNVENNEVDIQEEKTDSEKLGIIPETVSDDQIEESQETSQESVAADIHDSVDDDNSEKENIKIVIRNDEPETAKLKDEYNKEMDVGDVSDSYELAEGTTHKKVGKWHEEPSNSGCGKETCQLMNAQNNSEVDIQEEKVDSEKLEIASEMVSEDQTEESQETGQESVATNTGDLIDDDNSEKQITMVNQNDESETAKLKNDDNKEMNVGDISDSHELAERTTQERTGKQHEEITNSGCEEETHQMLNVEDNEIDIEEEKREMVKLGTDSESISGEQMEEINSELVATNIHGLIDDDNQLKIFKMVDEELETAKLKDEHNNELIIGDTLHEETSNSRCEADVHQTMNREDNYDLDIRDEKTDNEKLEITSESISENNIEETNCESVAINIGDVIYKSNQEAEIIRLVNLNDEPENAKLKDEDIKEMSIGDISDSRELVVEITIHDRVGKLNEETTNSGCQEETHQMKDAKEINEVDNQEEMTNTEKYEITSETVSEEQIEETNIEPVVTNFHDLIADDDNPEKEIVEVANLNVEPETVKLKDDNNKQMNVSDISDSCELSQKTIYHSIGKQQEEPTNSGCEEETYEVNNAEDKNEVDNLEDKMDAEKFVIATESGSKEKNSESVTTTIHDSVEDEKAENKQTIEMVGLNDNPGTEKVKDDDNEERNNGDIFDTPKSFEGTKHDRVDKQHEETTYTAGEEDIKQSSDSNNATEVAVDEDGAGTKKLELISDTMSENQEQYATYEAENTQMESTVGDCTSNNTTGILPISDMKYEDKVQEAGPVPNLSSSEVRKSIVHQISGNKRTYETIVSSLKEDVVEKAYKLDSQEKPKVFSMDERRDENLSKKEKIPETIIKNPSSNVSERLEESAEVFGQRQITEDGAIMDDDSVSIRCEPVKETCLDKEEYQMIEEEIPESTYRDQGDESYEKDDKKSRTTHDKGKNSGSITIPQNPESLAEIEPVNINLSENDENRTMKADPHEDQSYNASNICTEDGSLSHLNEERENVNVDDEESRNKRFDDLPVGTILTDKAGLQSDQRESTSKPEDMKDMILNEEILEARTETEADKNMIPEDIYKIADTETLKTNDEESISKNVENSPVMPTPVGETSEEIEESYDKALHDPHEKQFHQGISEIDSNTTGSGVIEEDISEGTLSVSVEGETNKHFSAEGNDCSHQEREGSKITQVKLLEEAKAIDEAGFVPSKQALDTEVDKLNDECGLVCKENLKSNEPEKNQEEEETVKEKEMDVCLDTSSNMASEKPVVAVQVESPCEQIEAATEAVKGIDKEAAESISISQENFEIKAGESSIEGGDKKNCDPAEDFHSTKESSAEKKLQDNTFEDKFEGLNHGVSKEQTDISKDNTNKEQDSWKSSETKELEDETQDEGNEIREEKEISQTINMGESNQNESSEERENSEKSKLEDVEIENPFSIVQEGVQTESGNCNRERLDKEDTDVNSEKIFHEDENNKDEEATVAMESAASDTAEGTTSDELELKSMTAREKAEDMDATNEKTEKMVDDFPNTDSMVELVTNVEASGSHSQMHKIELPTLESTKERFQSMGTRDEWEDERCEELNTKLQEDSKELIEHEHQSAIVLEGVQRTGSSEKIQEKIIIEQDISEAPRAWLKEETEDEQLQKDEIETQKKKELQTECETETTDILATDSSKEEGKEYDDAQSQNFPRTILTYEEEIASPVTKLEEKKNIDATPDAYIENETAHEQFQKDHIEAKNDKPQDEQELETTCIMAHESPYDEVKEFACKPSGHNSMSNLNFKIEPELSLNLEDENKNLDATPGACINNETSHKRLQKDEVLNVKKEPQTTEDKSPNNNVMECDCILSEQNSVMTVLTEETETTLPRDVQGEKKCSDATMNACMKDEQLQKDGIEAEKNNEPETRWELQTTDARANKSANNGATEFDSSPSENTFMTVFTEKIRGALLLTGENEKKNLDVTPSYCVKDETNHEQFQKNNTDSDKYEEPYDKWKMETTHVTKNESPNDEVKELDSISSEQDSLSAVLTKKIKTALSMGRMDEKKNTDADPGTCMKVETTNEQLEKDETSVENIKEPQANESPNYEVNKLDCIPLDENSVKILSTDHLETALLMDEGNEKKNLDALSLTGSAAEGIVHEVAQKNVVSNSMLSKHTEDEATVVELAKETCIEDLIEVHKLDYSSIDSGSLDEAIDAENITVHLSARGEEVPEWATDAVQVSEDSRIETLNQEDKEMIGKASRLVSKMEVDETNCSSVTLTEDEVKTRKSSTEQTTKARSPVERECMKHTEEDSTEVLEFDNSQNEEKRQDGDDLPVSRLLLEHILRNNSDMQDQTYDAVAEERGQEYDNISNHATTEKQGVSLLAELEETQKKLEDPSILSQKERIHDEEENTANAAVKEEETPQSIMKYASPSLSKSEDIKHNEQISNYEDITASLPTKIVTEETRISEDRSGAEKLENASDLKIDEVNQDKNNMGISEVTDDKEQNNIQNSSINAVDGVKVEISGLLYEASTHDVKIRNGSMKMTSDDPSCPNNNSQVNSVKAMTGNPENLNKDVEASFITKSSEDDISQDEGDEDGKVITEDVDKFENISHTKTEEKTHLHSETVPYTESILQSEETVPSSQYNQTAKSPESSISEIHNHEQKEEAASEIKSEDKNEEFGKESHREIAEIVQNVKNDSPEGPQIPDSPQVQESKLILESANEPVQIAARSMEERTIEISNNEKQIKAAPDTQIEEDNIDEEKEEYEHKIEGAGQDVKVNVEARDANSKKAHKKSHNILSGVGSKVKHSLAKVKKAITGKSSQPKATSPK